MGEKKFRKHIKMLEWQLESETRWAKDYFDDWQKALREITSLEKEKERLTAVGSQMWELIDQRDNAEKEVDTLRLRIAELEKELDTAKVGRSVRQQQIEQQDEFLVSAQKFIDSLEESHRKLSNRITELEDELVIVRKRSALWKESAKNNRAYWLMKCEASDRWREEYTAAANRVGELESEAAGMRRLLNALCLQIGDMPIWDDAEEESAYHFEYGGALYKWQETGEK